MKKMLSDSILDLGKCRNRKGMTEKMHVFRLGHFARSKIKYDNIFLIKYYIITFKSCAEGFGFFFKLERIFFSKWLVFTS